ncbi:sodium/potassium-transporting ATPase subunit beta-1-like isoform X2 [Coccinella septempunctata]|uniref:sodium/potassium-transporting ATPase subunit beta-1-like isoform X2 n=1 Tax=Coccinella septempunctata TaxID=41139 RepID=UPI001D07FC9E|nr:sodium/potassium-transporting ATPase subunit beta-1-like isoform X2 [Coccinella septempunctata]
MSSGTYINIVQIIFFYIIFYAVLALLFGGCMFCFYTTIDEKEPKRQLSDSLIGENPGLSIRPLSSIENDLNFIYYNAKNESQTNMWIKKLNDFMEPYMVPAVGNNSIECSFYRRPIGNEICKINLTMFGDCSPKDLYGYRTASPCIFLKLNKIYGWEPITYLLPTDDMPPDLKSSITSLPQLNRTQIWVSCNGLTPQDRDFVKEFKYFPSGFPSYFFPYRNGDNYLSPLVAVKIVYPKANVIIGIECRAWAKNIRYRGGILERVGSIQFYFQRDYFNVPIQ